TVRSMALKSLRVPPKVPNGVRTADRNTTSRAWPWVFTGSPMANICGRKMARHRDGGNCFARRPDGPLFGPGLAHVTGNPVAYLACSHFTADVSRTDSLADRRVHRLLDRSRRVFRAEVSEH